MAKLTKTTGQTMDRFAVLVDAGYLLSQSVQILSARESKSRKDVAIRDPQGLVSHIIEHAVKALGNPNLLRLYWYDGVSSRLSDEQEALSMLPDVQLRAGIISRSGVQKGVDSKIMVDLIELSNNHAITDAVLLTGDGDLVIGIELAQKRGVRVAALGIEDSAFGVGHNQSFELVCIADRVRRLARRDIEPYLAYVGARAVSSQPSAPSAPNDAENASKRAKPAAAAKAAAAPKPAAAAKAAPVKKQAAAAKKAKAATKAAPAKAAPSKAAPSPARNVVPELTKLSDIVNQFITAAVPPFTDTSITATGAIGQAVDGRLLHAATAALERKPTPTERNELRRLFRERLIGR
jgi:uncharacterized LabA/DUF88 family protein